MTSIKTDMQRLGLLPPTEEIKAARLKYSGPTGMNKDGQLTINDHRKIRIGKAYGLSVASLSLILDLPIDVIQLDYNATDVESRAFRRGTRAINNKTPSADDAPEISMAYPPKWMYPKYNPTVAPPGALAFPPEWIQTQEVPTQTQGNLIAIMDLLSEGYEVKEVAEVAGVSTEELSSILARLFRVASRDSYANGEAVYRFRIESFR
jgi:hypothetical protein